VADSCVRVENLRFTQKAKNFSTGWATTRLARWTVLNSFKMWVLFVRLQQRRWTPYPLKDYFSSWYDTCSGFGLMRQPCYSDVSSEYLYVASDRRQGAAQILREHDISWRMVLIWKSASVVIILKLVLFTVNALEIHHTQKTASSDWLIHWHGKEKSR
jgi:hypothetical protein